LGANRAGGADNVGGKYRERRTQRSSWHPLGLESMCVDVGKKVCGIEDHSEGKGIIITTLGGGKECRRPPDASYRSVKTKRDR